MYTLYSMQRSGNSYKVRLALAALNIPYELREVDIALEVADRRAPLRVAPLRLARVEDEPAVPFRG